MAFDGITVRALVHELQDTILDGRLNKIAQPEQDELLLTVKSPKGNYRLILSANASLPLAYLTENNKTSPAIAPNFCMLLRKHVNNARVVCISQPGLERVIDIEIEHLDEMGDLCRKHLIIELMGKYSNIIFTNQDMKIIDSIKRVNASVSSIREVLPGLTYFIPDTMNKLNPLEVTPEEVEAKLLSMNMTLGKAIYSSFTGLSPQFSEWLCLSAEVDSSVPMSALTNAEQTHLSHEFCRAMEDIKTANFAPMAFYQYGNAKDYSVVSGMALLYPLADFTNRSYSSVSEMIEQFYAQKNLENRIHSRSADLRQVITTLLERNVKKLDLQEKQIKDTEKREEYRIKGELLQAYAYQIVSGSESATVLNYYSNEEITIALDADLSIHDNAQKYFARYNKLKRTYEALSSYVEETRQTISHLESIDTAISLATDYEDLIQIKEEMVQFGFIKSHGPSKGKAVKSKSKPLHYRSSDGFDIFVGKNNLQNEELTFKIAAGDDWWFHAKNMPGSHVIVKSNHEELPDKTFEEAAALAAYYSKGANQDKVEIDYVLRKEVKKVSGAAPGFVIYHTNYSMAIAPHIENIELLSN